MSVGGAADITQLHEAILYPTVRVRAGAVGGSGIIVYSQPDVKDPALYTNVVLTCQHVIDKAITITEEWDPVLKQDRKVDRFEEVRVELFDYSGSKVISVNSTPADIIAYDRHHDLAALRLQYPRQLPYVAKIVTEDQIKQLKIGQPVWTSGCSLLHDPFPNPGTLTYLREIIEQKAYLMSNAPSIFGNSGGGLFHGEWFTLLGLTSRVTTLQLGFGLDVMTWMQFSTHPDRLYEFFRDQELQFLYDPADDYYSAISRREKRQREALRQILLEGSPS